MSNPKELQQALEEQMLDPWASFSSKSKGRDREEAECNVRTCYQRDIDRILHCKAFRRLRHKTQVFLRPVGDHYRTRLTHTLEVTRISRTIARALRLNEDLAEAIALGHDIGHAPFGHAGERAFNDILSDEGGFKHNEQSVRIAQYIEQGGAGLNLTFEVRNGILCHTGSIKADTMEGNIVRISDRIAYINHDIDDSVRAGIISESEIPEEINQILGSKYSERINTLILDLITESRRVGDISLSSDVATAFDTIRDFMFDNVYLNTEAKNEEAKVYGIISKIFDHFCENYDVMPGEYQRIADNDGVKRAVTDYVSGMTDEYALHIYEKLFIPEAWQVR